MICRKYVVHGKVQGVWFRESTRRLAVELGVTGHAINLPDGTVEVVAKGEEASIEKLSAWLQQGPPMARVDRLEQFDFGEEVSSGFRTG
jgi:acylphosphatase